MNKADDAAMEAAAFPKKGRSWRRVCLNVASVVAALFTLGWLFGIPADLGFSSWRRPTGNWSPPGAKTTDSIAHPTKTYHNGPITPLADIDLSPDPSIVHSDDRPTMDLAELALVKVLDDAHPIFGKYENVQTETSTWMSRYADETKVVHMNIPGTHDSATWNYSLETQQSLHHVTDLVNDELSPPAFYQCQERSLVKMLNAGIRAFDLRYAQDVTNSTLVFWHGSALQSETATVEDVLYGFYHWLDHHPTEALFLSFQYEPSLIMGNTNNAEVQMQLYDTLTSPAAKRYIVQTRDRLGTLGEARGKITLLRRFDLDSVPRYCENTIPGVHFSPKAWTVNGANITLVFNNDIGELGTAYIEDYYRMLTLPNSTSEENILSKLDATEAHLRRAAISHPESLFWTFASSTNTGNTPPNTPRTQALGSGSETPDGGVNQRLVPTLKSLKGKRLGIVMFDFYEEPEELLPLFLSLLSPDQAGLKGR